MIIPDAVRNRDGIGCQTRQIKCPRCKGPLDFDIIYFVREDDWPEFRNLLNSGAIEDARCDHCGEVIKTRSPLIYEIPHRNLIAFATHGEDDGGALPGFEKWKENCRIVLDQSVFATLEKRPYTFVQGWNGLAALLDCFDGNEAPISDGGDGEALDSIMAGYGYIYGNLFFYHAGYGLVERLSSLMLAIASVAEESGKQAWALEVLHRTFGIMGAYHPWCVHEAGRLALAAGELEVAEEHLRKAVELRHSFLAVTASYLDATPTAREDGPTQSSSLPHAQRGDALGDVTANRHVVTLTFPRTRDLGKWCFEETEKFATPESHTLDRALMCYAIAIAEFERNITRDRLPVSPLHVLKFSATIQHALELLEYSDEDGRMAFFEVYVQTAWSIDSASPMQHLRAAVQQVSNTNDNLNVPSDLVQLWRRAVLHFELLEKP